MNTFKMLSFAAVLAASVAVRADEAAPDLETDVGLGRFLLNSDGVLRNFGECTHVRIERQRHRSFSFTARCERYDGVTSDCPTYQVTASGTVDSEASATLREINLKLECYS